MNMNRVLSVAVCAGMLGVPCAIGQGDLAERIAFVNMEVVFEQYYKTTRADRRLKDQAAEFNTERQEMIASLEAMETDYNSLREESSDETLSEDARDNKRSGAEDLLRKLLATEKEIKQFELTRRRQLEEQGQRMRKRIVEDIDKVVEKFASDRKLFAVIDNSGSSLNQVPVFLYSNPNADITPTIVSLLNVDQEEADDWSENEDAMEEGSESGPENSE